MDPWKMSIQVLPDIKKNNYTKHMHHLNCILFNYPVKQFYLTTCENVYTNIVY